MCVGSLVLAPIFFLLRLSFACEMFVELMFVPRFCSDAHVNPEILFLQLPNLHSVGCYTRVRHSFFFILIQMKHPPNIAPARSFFHGFYVSNYVCTTNSCTA